MTRIVESLAEIAAPYDALFCDLWGCVHDGHSPFPEAVAALQAFRAAGKQVILVTNAPRHRTSVERQLAKMGLPTDTWDAIATSGDAARAAMFTGAVGEKIWFMGEPHDRSFFDPLKIIENPVAVREVPLEEADGIVCCGPFDPMADPTDLRPALLLAKEKGLPLLCANPDIVVDRGDTREWCAGAVAALYAGMGGESLYFGKPHPPIYDLARRRLAALGTLPPDSRILAVGDGILTDIKGALGEDIDSLFITGGLAREETGTTRQPVAEKLDAYVSKEMIAPTYAIGYLR
ncbi:TIGR01459 family HAD-type hydrolase [Maritimibacter sp. DP1N21-5]|uniref:TIGR01459 family HAD-type hydrolase n=1 Tax=Maritimibacter sp. DP1N21-5 TaxID=2836867 RepID=UPI001C4393BE|nr:TIGR01459 family HAD-type hydrolase [Maritimibacter sp. DP1N21-5]MBV7410570.1 TIGR01459 family HAD-type hydrolase [Maritimibacter sp. DP1N21-5]